LLQTPDYFSHRDFVTCMFQRDQRCSSAGDRLPNKLLTVDLVRTVFQARPSNTAWIRLQSSAPRSITIKTRKSSARLSGGRQHVHPPSTQRCSRWRKKVAICKTSMLGNEDRRLESKLDKLNRTTRVGSGRQGERVATWQPWPGLDGDLARMFEERISVRTIQALRRRRHGSKERENQV
jgi:hypothetical protein